MKEQKIILQDIAYIKSIYKKLITILPSFDVTDSSVLPYGLRPHTRSVSWLVEQVITQQSKFHANQLGLIDVDFSMPDTALHDCILHTSKKDYYINIKIHNADKKENKNDICAVEKIYMQYMTNSEYNIIYVCLGIVFDNINISFDQNYLEVFSVQFLPIYVNPRNDKIQALYKHIPEYRTRKEFLKLLESKSTSITLKK